MIRTWGDLKPGDVFHWRDESDDCAFLVLEAQNRGTYVSLRLLELDTGKLVCDERQINRNLPHPVHQVDLAPRAKP